MTVEEYRAEVSKLGLRRSSVPTVYLTGDGSPQNVPDPERLTPERRQEIIDRLKNQMGVWRTN
jgi:hypothetical protein